jgi:hypothetical protein
MIHIRDQEVEVFNKTRHMGLPFWSVPIIYSGAAIALSFMLPCLEEKTWLTGT